MLRPWSLFPCDPPLLAGMCRVVTMEVRGSWRTLLGDGAGSYFGLLNMVTWLALNAELWWMGVVHVPLLVISTAGLVLSMRMSRSRSQKSHTLVVSC